MGGWVLDLRDSAGFLIVTTGSLISSSGPDTVFDTSTGVSRDLEV